VNWNKHNGQRREQKCKIEGVINIDRLNERGRTDATDRTGQQVKLMHKKWRKKKYE
jgi:hypothetical protein